MAQPTRKPGARSTALFLVFAALLVAAGIPAQAESGAYRIEVLVFRHLDANAEPLLVDPLRSFSWAWNLDADRDFHIPEDPAPLGVMSDRMSAVWRTLARQEAYEPLKFEVWEQSRIDFHPPVRIHDDEIIADDVSLDLGGAWGALVGALTARKKTSTDPATAALPSLTS